MTSESASGVLALRSGKVLIHTINGGTLSGANGQRIGALIRIDPSTGAIDPTWQMDPNVVANGFLGVAEAPDGKIYYSTSLASEVAKKSTDPAMIRLIRLNTDGSRDTTFNSPIFSTSHRFLAVQPDGKVIACYGGVNSFGVPPPDPIARTVRLNTDGSLDTTFQSPNFQFSATSPNEYGVGVFGNPVVDPSTGKIYFCGNFRFVNGQARKAIARINPDGTLDSSFVPTGLIGGTTSLSGRALVLQASGKVVLGGPNLRTAAGGSTRYALLRFNNDGALDSTFALYPTTNSSGTATIPGYFGPRDIHGLPGGKILTSDIRVLRFLTDGAVDSAFTPLDYSSPYGPNTGQIAGFRFSVNPSTGEAYLQNPGPLYAMLNGAPVGGIITKLTAQGTIDSQFAPPVVESENFAPDVQLDGTGKVYVSGYHTAFGNTPNSTIARLLSNGARDAAYSLETLPFQDKQAARVALLPDGAAYVAYYSGAFNGGPYFSNLVRLSPTGAIDTTFRLSGPLQAILSLNAFDGNDRTKFVTPPISPAPGGGVDVFSEGDFQQTVNTNGNLKVVRINPNGIEDTSVPPLAFPVGEIVRDPSFSNQITTGSIGYLQRLASTSDGGAIVLASVAPFPTNTGAPYNFRILKLRPGGTQDPSFTAPSIESVTPAVQTYPVIFDPVLGTSYQPPFGVYSDGERSVASTAIFTDGSFLLTGKFRVNGGSAVYTLAKFTGTGALDPSFTPPNLGPQNVAQPSRPAYVTNARVAPDGKIWVLGRFDTFAGSPAPGVARLNANGTLDSTFQLTGVGHYDYSFRDSADVVFANNNTAYLVGTFRRPGEPVPFAVTRIVTPGQITVGNTSDSGAGSLRQAIADARDGDTIVFAAAPSPRADATTSSTISLTSGPLVINKNVTITGPGADLLTVARASGVFRVFHVTPGRTVKIEGMTIASGNASQGSGAGIYNDHATLTVEGCAFSDNIAALYGGAIANDGTGGTATLIARNCTFRNNGANPQGGAAIDNDGSNGGNATATVVNSTFSTNGGGAGVYNRSGTMAVANCTFYKNSTVNLASANGGTLNIASTILKASTTGPNILSVSSGPITSRGYNVSDDIGGGFLTATGDQINTDPVVGPLKDNGGPTLTHAPLSNSPAIDRGKDIDGTGVDQRGSQRPVTYSALITPPTGGDRTDIGAVELAPGVIPTSAVSRKMHGTAGPFDVNLPLTGPVGVECRSGGAANEYQVVVTFAAPVTFTSAALNDGTGTVNSTAGSGTNTVTFNLTGVTNAQRITLALFDVQDGTNTSDVGVRMGMLIGDTNNSGGVTTSDIGQTKAQSGIPVTSANFRQDVTPNGTINASDIGLVKSRSGQTLP